MSIILGTKPTRACENLIGAQDTEVADGKRKEYDKGGRGSV